MAEHPHFDIDLSSLEFTDSLKSGNPEIDAEHIHMLKSAQDLIAASSGGRPSREVQALLDDLIRDMAVHFAHEDRVMNHTGWSEAEHHAGIHRLLMAEANRLAEQHRASMISFLDIYRFVVGTLVRDHLAIHDTEFHHFLEEQP